MLRSFVAAVTVAASLAFGPPASADPEQFGCVGGEEVYTTDGSSYVTAAVGYLVHPQGGVSSARCFIRANGSTQVGSTQAGTFGPGYAVAYGPIRFTATPYDTLEICFEGRSDHGGLLDCRPVYVSQVPPQAVWDAVCAMLVEIGTRGFNILGLVVIDPGGDVYVNGSRVHDC